MAILELDNMEYASDGLAQAAYVTNAGFDSYTKLLLHLDNDVTDSAQGITVTNNNATFATRTDWGYAAVFNGSTAYLTIPDSDDWNFGSGDFTLECWAKWATVPTANTPILSQFGADGNFSWVLLWESSQAGIALGICPNGQGASWTQFTATWTPTADTWYHIACVRNGGNLYFFIDGTQVGSTISVSFTLFNSSALVCVASNSAYYLNQWFSGSIDEVRISKGIARWTSNFTKPTEPYSDDLHVYSESTIKTQGSYSLKGIAKITDSLNKTLTKTFSTNSNLTGVKNLKFDIYSSRTGANIKVGIHDTGGTTTEITPNIISANTWQTVKFSLAGVADADKDAIDKIIVTIVNADAANTFYLDYAEIAQTLNVFGLIN